MKIWFTINEPKVIAIQGYEAGIFAPGKTRPGYGTYRVVHTMLKAHARAWHTYDQKYRATQGGKISIVFNSFWSEPADPENQADVEAAERMRMFELGSMANPIFGNGSYHKKYGFRGRGSGGGGVRDWSLPIMKSIITTIIIMIMILNMKIIIHITKPGRENSHISNRLTNMPIYCYLGYWIHYSGQGPFSSESQTLTFAS